MKKVLLVFLILSIFKIKAQQKQIELPKGGIEIKTKLILALLDIYLSEDGKLYLNDSSITYNDLPYKLRTFQETHHDIFKFKTSASLHIDVKTPLKYVDMLETKIQSTGLDYYYSTSAKNDLPYGLYINLRTPTYFFENSKDKTTSTSKPTITGRLSNFKQHKFAEFLLLDKLEKANSLLKELDYSTISFLKNDSILIDNKKINHKNSKKLYELLKAHSFFIIKYFPNLSYLDYFKNLKSIRNSVKKHTINRADNPYILKISSELNEKIVEGKIKLKD